MASEWKKLNFTVDYPALYKELKDNNIQNLGYGVIMGLHIVLMELDNIAKLAVKHNDIEILQRLEYLGIVEINKNRKDNEQ